MRKIKEAVSSVGDKIRIDMLLDALQGKDISNLTIIFGTCKDCKHWKDSDGVYRRGIGAESKCPVNNSRVFEGNFCCADFEKRGGEK